MIQRSIGVTMSNPVICIEDVRKSFTLHLQDGVVISVFEAASLAVERGECVVLTGASGIGKSTLLKLIYGSYKPFGGRLLLRHEDEEIDLARRLTRCSRSGDTRSAMSASSCAVCRACPRSTW